MTDGEVLRTFVDNQKITKKKIYQDLEMSKQNFYQFFESKVLQPETKKKFEDYFGQTIFTEGARVVTEQLQNTDQQITEDNEHLEKSIWGLVEDRKRAIAVIERLTAVLESREKRVNEIKVDGPGMDGTKSYTKEKSAK